MEPMLRRIYCANANGLIYMPTTRRNGKRPWSRRTQLREMTHDLCTVHVRNARLCLGQTRTEAHRLFPLAGECELRVASAAGRARDRTLSSKRQVHRRGRARDRAALFLDAITQLTKGDLKK